MKKGILPLAFLTTVLWFASNDNAHSQGFNKESGFKPEVEEPLMLQAGKKSASEDIVTVYVTKGPDNMDQFNAFTQAVVEKMKSKGVPLEFIIDPVRKEGATLAYFIGDKMHGPFNFEEFVGVLPLIVENYEKEYGKPTAAIFPISDGQQLTMNGGGN